MNSHNKSPDKRLCALFTNLSEADRQTLLAFAEFLYARQQASSLPELAPPQPIPHARPAQESVVAAIKRLAATYPMLDKSKMLHETAGLMTQHLMQGRAASEIIDELESVFLRYYTQLQDSFATNTTEYFTENKTHPF